MEKRYQVFISSTFADLQDERAKVQQTIMEMDCIPAGMEVFPAIDEEQFEFIKKVIDDSDYYILIIGGRYGSLSDAGVSYTEMEYEYAISKGIKVMAFLHNDPSSLPVKKTEQVTGSKKKLAAFRDKVATGRLVKFWSVANDLPGLVALSLSKTIKTYPAIGWIRGDSAAEPELYKQLADLRKENQELREELSKRGSALLLGNELAGFEDEVVLIGYGDVLVNIAYVRVRWVATVTWGKLFGYAGASLISPMQDADFEGVLARWVRMRSDKASEKMSKIHFVKESYQNIIIQFKALGLVMYDDMVWSLTESGERETISLRVARKAVTKPETESDSEN